ncbi:unnamed protein product [Rotaria socialis]|uniref:Uncharacterized protein n=1 Tax=Rotaria socialis TaxID=392032 RepID=A0A818CYL3_9BILA|nr:unnamed protein product [Rotaria socialis]
MTTNADYCKTYRQRISNVSSRLQDMEVTLQDHHQVNVNDNNQITNNEINSYADQIITTHTDEQELNDLNDIAFNNNVSNSSEYETETDSYISYESDFDDDIDTLLYSNGSIPLYKVYAAIKNFIIKCNLNHTHILQLIELLLFLLPSGHRLTKSGILHAQKRHENFTYTTLCINCNQQVKPAEGKCLSTCRYYGKERTSDCLTEIGEANVLKRIKNVVKRNLTLILEYQQRAELLLPNDIVNSAAYQHIHSNSKFNRLTLMLHADGIQIVTTKRKKFYVVTGTILEIPPPHREYARNKLLFLVYFSENEPTPSILYDHLCQQIRQLIIAKWIIIGGQKFSIRFQLFKADLPCRSLSICIKQHNGYYCCSNCFQHGKTMGGTYVYYDYIDKQATRSHHDYLSAAIEAERNENQISVFGIHGKSPLLSLFFNVQINCPFDYMHLCCSTHMSSILNIWIKKYGLSNLSCFMEKIIIPVDSLSITSLNCLNFWKSKDYRFFLLFISFPLILAYGTDEVIDHFMLYFVSIRVLHFYESIQDVMIVKPLLDKYREDISHIYGDEKLQLYSLHAHKYLIEQVLSHGALFAHGCFGDESFLGTLKRSRRGNRRIPYQILKSYLLRDCILNDEHPKTTVNSIFLDEKIFDNSYLNLNVHQNYFIPFQKLFQLQFNEKIDKNFSVYCRYQRGMVKFSSLLYNRISSQLTNIVSFKNALCPVNKKKCFAIIIWYFEYENITYAFIKSLQCINKVLRTTRTDQLGNIAHSFLNRFFSVMDIDMFDLSIIRVQQILHHCVVIPFRDACLFSEILCTYEHD